MKSTGWRARQRHSLAPLMTIPDENQIRDFVQARLSRPVDAITDIRRSRVLRAHFSGDAPRSAIIKRALDGDRLESLHCDWAALSFLADIDPKGPWPAFLGGDREANFILMEDFERHRQLDHILLEGEAGEAREAMKRLAASIAQLHASAHEDTNRYLDIRRALGDSDESDPAPHVLNFARRAAQFGFDNGTLSAELDRCIDALRNPGAFATLTHGDPCPDNCFMVNDRAVLIDFEWAGIRHALGDGVYVWLPFPSCWCVNGLEPGLSQTLLDIYRAGITDAIPEAGDDELFGLGLTAATVAGLERYFSKDVFEEDDTWGIATLRQRWRARLDVIDDTARRFGFPAISACANRLMDQADKLWPDLEPLPLYPAFRR